MKFLEKYDNEKYLELLLDWKKKNEAEYLKNKPWLNWVQNRQEKILAKSSRDTIRG